MVEIAITRMSSKGQIVIPVGMREDFAEGEKLLVIKDKGRLILKQAKKLDEKLREDLIFAKRTEEAWKRYDKGLFRTMSADDFLKELEKW